MPTFRVRLIDGDRLIDRRVECADAAAAATGLGVAADRVVSILPDAPPRTARAAAVSGTTRRRFPLRLFSQELSVLLRAGIALLEAIVTLSEKESSPAVREALEAVSARLREGARFSQALASRPDAFDPLFVAIATSAEKTGQLGDALSSHAAYLAWVDDLRGKILSACIYPLILIVAGVSVLLFLLVFVVPRFAGLLDGLAGDIPAASRLLIDIGAFTGTHPLATLAVGALLLASPWLAWRNAGVRAGIDSLLWSVPVLGDKLRLLALARLYRTMGMLLGAGVPVVAALEISAGVVAPRLRRQLDAVRQAVSRGERLSIALEREHLATPVSVRMARVGERSGELGPMLSQAAAFYDEELTRLSELVTRLINPLLMLLMGGVIGTVIVLMYLPIFQLVEQVQ